MDDSVAQQPETPGWAMWLQDTLRRWSLRLDDLLRRVGFCLGRTQGGRLHP
jgi:hypothetical protein